VRVRILTRRILILSNAEPEALGVSAEHAIETGKLIVELLKTVAMRRDSPNARSAAGSAARHVSPHAIRAAISSTSTAR